MNTYGRYDLALVRGEGMTVYDPEGNAYLDFVGGIAVTALGHCHPAVTRALTEQAATLIHVSNLYYTLPQVELARILTENCFADRVFLCNSGAEANEAGIKLARKYSYDHYGPDRFTVVTMDQSFHGRTMATLSATGQPKIHKGFTPPGHRIPQRALGGPGRPGPGPGRHGLRGVGRAHPGGRRRQRTAGRVLAKTLRALPRTGCPGHFRRGAGSAWAAPASCSPMSITA